MQYTFIIISIVLFIIILISIVNIFRKINKLQKSNIIMELQSEINELVLELNQTADRNINILEEKINTLTRVLKDADKRIKILKNESEKVKSDPVTYNSQGKIQDNLTTFKVTENKQIKNKVLEINKKERILELHNNGFTSPVIASRVGLTVGEVELIISLVEGR